MKLLFMSIFLLMSIFGAGFFIGLVAVVMILLFPLLVPFAWVYRIFTKKIEVSDSQEVSGEYASIRIGEVSILHPESSNIFFEPQPQIQNEMREEIYGNGYH